MEFRHAADTSEGSLASNPPGRLERAPTVLIVEGAAGSMRLTIREGCGTGIVPRVLADPDRFVPPAHKASQVRKLKARRAVYSFHTRFQGNACRLYLKLYRIRTLKDIAEELLFGKRALRSLATALQAEARGITVPHHLGASCRDRPEHWPGRSALLMEGIPHNRDVRTVLKHEFSGHGATGSRKRFLSHLGGFIGDAHRRGLVHRDLKIRNLFVLTLAPLHFALIDLDRSRMVAPNTEHGLFAQALDLRSLFRSLRGRSSSRERRMLLAAYLRRRKLSPSGRKRLLRRLVLVGGI